MSGVAVMRGSAKESDCVEHPWSVQNLMPSVKAIALVALWLLAPGCGRGESAAPSISNSPQSSADSRAQTLPADQAKKCVVLLHGKGGDALPSTVDGDTEFVRPAGNRNAWGGKE